MQVKHSGGLIKGTADILSAIEAGNDRSYVVEGFRTMLETMESIEKSMEVSPDGLRVIRNTMAVRLALRNL